MNIPDIESNISNFKAASIKYNVYDQALIRYYKSLC